jgi:hypothetical protein
MTMMMMVLKNKFAISDARPRCAGGAETDFRTLALHHRPRCAGGAGTDFRNMLLEMEGLTPDKQTSRIAWWINVSKLSQPNDRAIRFDLLRRWKGESAATLGLPLRFDQPYAPVTFATSLNHSQSLLRLALIDPAAHTAWNQYLQQRKLIASASAPLATAPLASAPSFVRKPTIIVKLIMPPPPPLGTNLLLPPPKLFLRPQPKPAQLITVRAPTPTVSKPTIPLMSMFAPPPEDE